jgi:lipopolysaccharide export system permease protein
MKTITKYIVKETLFVSTLGFFIFTFLLIMNSLFVLSDLVIKYGVDFFNVLKMLFLLLPSTVAVTVPMAFLVGVLLTYSRLVQDNEYTGMQASGISIKDISTPAIGLALVVTLLMILFNNYVLAWANLSYKKLYYEIVKKRSSVLIQEHRFIKDFDNYIFYIGERDSKTDTLKNIAVFVKPPAGSQDRDQARVILSKNGELISDESSYRIALKLKDGIMQAYSYASPLKMSQMMFGTNYIDLDIKGAFRDKQPADDMKGTREMTVEELIKEVKLGTASRQDKNWTWVELHKKFSIPFAVLAFTILGIPLGLMTKKGGRLAGISLSLVLIFIYYILLFTGQTFGYRGKWDYFFAIWLPNIFLAIIGLILYIILFLPAFKRALKQKGGRPA